MSEVAIITLSDAGHGKAPMKVTTLKSMGARTSTVSFFQSFDIPVPSSVIGGAEGIVMAFPPF
jgi:hypothetical protein